MAFARIQAMPSAGAMGTRAKSDLAMQRRGRMAHFVPVCVCVCVCAQAEVNKTRTECGIRTKRQRQSSEISVDYVTQP